MNEDAKSAFVIVPDNQLSLAIGKSGQNVRLAARLTGWRIDIRSESQVVKAALIDATTPQTEEQATAPIAPVVEPAPAPAPEPAKAKQPQPVDEDTPDDTLPMIEIPDFPSDGFDESEEAVTEKSAH